MIRGPTSLDWVDVRTKRTEINTILGMDPVYTKCSINISYLECKAHILCNSIKTQLFHISEHSSHLAPIFLGNSKI